MRFTRQSWGWKVVILVSAICSAWMVADNRGLSQTPDQDLIETLEAIWNAQRSEITTASIRYRSIVSGSGGVKKLTPAEVHKIVADLAARPDDFASIVLQFHNPVRRKQLENLENPWDIKEFKSENNKTREDWHAPSGTNVNVFDGEQVVITNPANNQIDLHAPGRSRLHRTKLGEFRLVPRLPSEKDRIRIRDRGNGRVVFRILGGKGRQAVVQELSIDETTGMVNQASRGNGKGKVYSEVFQSGFVTYSGGIVFPSAIVKTRYMGGKLRFLEIQMVEEARFNEDLAADVFTVNVSAKNLVVDCRHDQNKPSFVKTRTAVPDIVADISKTTNISLKTEGNYVHWEMVAVSACLLLAIITILWYQRRSGTQRR